jgi:hypothetical protein
VAVGTNFTFNVAGTAITVPAGAAPGGVCGTPVTVPAGPVGITETIITPGVVLTAVTTSPPVALVSSNLAAGTATVTVTTGAITIVIFTDALIGVPPPDVDVFLVHYAANLGSGDSVVNITNTGTTGGSICVNVYTFSPDEQLISCCACTVTPNGLVSLSARNDLISNTLTPAVPNSIVIKLLSTVGGPCSASAPGTLAPGLAAWGTTLHSQVGSAGFAVTETAFTPASFGETERARIRALCGFIQSNGSRFGVCRSCQSGALGGAGQ